MTGDTTPEKTGLHAPWKPGQSGNPAGRPKGSKNKLGEDFVKALADDFAIHGNTVINAVRVDKPEVYMKIVADMVPKDMNLDVEARILIVTGVPRPGDAGV